MYSSSILQMCRRGRRRRRYLFGSNSITYKYTNDKIKQISRARLPENPEVNHAGHPNIQFLVSWHTKMHCANDSDDVECRSASHTTVHSTRRRTTSLVLYDAALKRRSGYYRAFKAPAAHILSYSILACAYAQSLPVLPIFRHNILAICYYCFEAAV